MAPSSKIRCGRKLLHLAADGSQAMRSARWARKGLGILALWVTTTANAWEVDARFKWFGSLTALPEEDLQRQATGTPAYTDDFDLRLMVRHRQGPVSLILDHSTTLSRSDNPRAPEVPWLTLDQSANSDERRLLDLTWELDEGKRHRLLHRFDRLAVRYDGNGWAVTAGREAVSWGNGLVFQPLDLFNPFAPTTVDRDYKTGHDLILVERLFPGGSDLQLLAVARRDAEGAFASDVSSLAGKWHVALGEGEVELIAAAHYDDQVYGLGWRWPVGGALVRSDLTATRLQSGTWKISGIVNADYSFVIGGRNLYVFGEYFHSSFGVRELPEPGVEYPQPLLERLGRGELFNLMRDYLATGVTVEWHPLWNHATTLMGNLQDASLLLQSQLSFDPSDQQRLDLGVVHPFGSRGNEFGGVPAARDPSGSPLTVGGGTSAYLRWVYYF